MPFRYDLKFLRPLWDFDSFEVVVHLFFFLFSAFFLGMILGHMPHDSVGLKLA